MRRLRLAVRPAALALSLVLAGIAGFAALAAPLAAVTPITPQKTGGKVTVNGKPLGVNHAYLFHAPDNW